MISFSSSSLVSRSPGVLSFNGSVMDSGSKWLGFDGSGGKEQDEARCPFLWHLKQSPFSKQFSRSLEESLGIQEVGSTGVLRVISRGV